MTSSPDNPAARPPAPGAAAGAAPGGTGAHPSEDVPAAAREQALRAGLDAVKDRIGRACQRHDRAVEDVTLIVVTKTYPAADIRRLAGMGVIDVGENRHQEAVAKHRELADVAVRWHHVGQLQTNKAAAVARYADVVHSVDRSRLVRVLDRGAQAEGRRLAVLIQVSLDGPVEDVANHVGRAASGTAGVRGGVSADAISELAEDVAATAALDLRGLMAVAPRVGDPDVAFARLRACSERLRQTHPDASWISAGMSGDLEHAIAHGATHLRVGSAILGPRALTG